MARRDEPGGDPFAAIGCDDVVPIGSGGSSIVYRARQRAFDRLIALKVLSQPLADERSRRRFERELALAGRLTGHPNAVTVFSSGFFGDGRAYVQMEYCPGGSLADRLAAQGPFPAREVVSIGVKMAGVLELARTDGIIHRDVKPANVLVTRFGEPALADFGIAIVSGEMTGTTQALTPVHAAPEVLESREVGPAADQWSLGSTLHTLLAGRPPFATDESDGLLAGMLRILNDPVPPIPRGDLPDSLRSVLERTMAKSPAERWPTPADLGRALQEVERREGWPVTALATEEVEETRYALGPVPAEPVTGDVGPPGTGLDPRTTYVVPPPSPPLSVAGGSTIHWERERGPAPESPAAPVPAAPSPTPAPPAPPPARSSPVSPISTVPPAPDEAMPAPPPAAPVPPPSPFSPPPLVAPAGSSPGQPPAPSPASGAARLPSMRPGEVTEHWHRPRAAPEEAPPPVPESSNRRWWYLGGGGGAAVLLVVVVAILLSRHGSRPTTGPVVTHTVPTNPIAALLPTDLHLTSENGSADTVAWTARADGLTYFVQDANQLTGQTSQPAEVPSDPMAKALTYTATGLTPGVSYCFSVGVVNTGAGVTFSPHTACTSGASAAGGNPSTTASLPGAGTTAASG